LASPPAWVKVGRKGRRRRRCQTRSRRARAMISR
jgi:hypothetical protein